MLIEPPKFTRGKIKKWLDDWAIRRERAKHGISKPDTWALHDYLGIVMANGLRILARDSHGWPGTKEFPTPESWSDKLNEIADKLQQASTRDAQVELMHGEIAWTMADEPAGIEEFEAWINSPNTPEFEEYARRHSEIDELADRNAKEALEWLAEHWFHLWD